MPALSRAARTEGRPALSAMPTPSALALAPCSAAAWGQRLLAQFWLKFFGIPACIAAFFGFYIYLLNHPQGSVVQVALTPIDDWVAMQPLALPVYLSLWLYVSLPPAILRTRAELMGFGARIGLVCGLGLLIFWLWPTAVPPAHVDWALYPGMAFLKGVDAAGNACPSLHVATAVFSGIWMHRLLGEMACRRGLQVINALWCVAIGYSTMATKQHVFWDVLGGVALALAVAALTWPRPTPQRAP